MIRKAIRAGGGRDVDLDDDEIRRVVEVERFDVLVLNLHVVVLQVRGERREAERRKERVLDRTKERTGRLG